MYLRIILIIVLVYLVTRIVRQFIDGNKNDDDNIDRGRGGKRVSKDTGEYVDYEEVED